MSYQCQLCGVSTEPGVPLRRAVTERRARRYENPPDAERIESFGWEIDKQVRVGPCCAEEAERLEAQAAAVLTREPEGITPYRPTLATAARRY